MLTIRKAKRDDAPNAWDIRHASVHAACVRHYPEATLCAWVDGAPSDAWAAIVERGFYLALDNDRPVGTGMLTVESGQVDAIFVQPSHIGRGIGRRMLEYLEALARESGLVDLRLDATLNAAPFYREHGWVGDSVSTYRSPRGLELACIPMTKRL